MTSTALVPEFLCRDSSVSMAFYRDVLGFSVRYDRPSEGFFYIERDGAEIMLVQQAPGSWVGGALATPFGRGMHLQIIVQEVGLLLQCCLDAEIPIFRDIEDAWYRAGEHFVGQRQFVCQDPDGYLLRFAEHIGTRTKAPMSGRIVS